MSRTRKQPYRQSRRFDKSCRCHGGCPWCRGNRLYSDRKRRQAAEQEARDYWRGDAEESGGQNRAADSSSP